MRVKDYQYINTLNSGSTTYEYDVAKYFGVDTTKDIESVRKELVKFIEYDKDYKSGSTYTMFKGKKWMIEDDILSGTFEQWTRLETILSEEDNVKNLHKLLAIYFRPMRKKGFFKYKIETFSLEKQDGISEELLDLPIEVANSIMVFFYQFVPKLMKNIGIQFLNQKITK
jgi:hypothetical protein